MKKVGFEPKVKKARESKDDESDESMLFFDGGRQSDRHIGGREKHTSIIRATLCSLLLP